MKTKGFEIFALLLCSCLFGIILSLYSSLNLVTDREMCLVLALYVATTMTLFAGQSNKHAIVYYLSRHKTEIEMKQVADVQDAHRRHIILIKNEHNTQIHQLQGSLNTANAKFDCLNSEYNWMCAAYKEQMRTNQEQQDHINFLEDERKQNGQSTPTIRLPFSAPASQIEFANPPRRAHFGSAMNSPAVSASSPLAQISEACEKEKK